MKILFLLKPMRLVVSLITFILFSTGAHAGLEGPQVVFPVLPCNMYSPTPLIPVPGAWVFIWKVEPSYNHPEDVAMSPPVHSTNPVASSQTFAIP